MDGAELGVCKGAVAERQIHLEGMRGGFPIEAGFFEVGALSAFKGVMLDGGFKCLERGIGFEGYFVAMVHFIAFCWMEAFLLAATLGKWLRVRALNGEIFVKLCIIPPAKGDDKTRHAAAFNPYAGGSE